MHGIFVLLLNPGGLQKGQSLLISPLLSIFIFKGQRNKQKNLYNLKLFGMRSHYMLAI